MLDVKRILSEYKRVDDWKKINILIETNKVNKEELIAEVLKSGNSDFILWTALYVEGAPVENLRDALIETSDLDNLLSFAINATGTSQCHQFKELHKEMCSFYYPKILVL